MPYPTLYDVTYSYTAFQESQGDNSFPGTQIDADLAGLQASIESLDVFMQTVIRSDGALNNGIVTYDSLSASLQVAGLAPANAWLTAHAYLVGNTVVISSNLYRCLIDHMSGVFATDLAAGKWLFIAALQAGAQGAAGTNGTNGVGYGGTSATSLLIANGVTKVFTTQAGLAYQVGGYVRASSAANGANFMEGFVSAYAGTSLSIAVAAIGGSGTFADWNFASAGIPGSVPPGAPTGRLTLTSGVPLTTSDVTAATVLCFTPSEGDTIVLWNGSSWVPTQFTEKSVKLTDAQSGATHTNTTIDGLTDTSQLVVGMQVTGINVAANTVINSIASPTSVIVNNATTGSATNTMTFKLPPSQMYDVWGYLSSGALKLELLAWTNDTTRATALAVQNGVDVKTGDATRRLLGSIRMTTVAGQAEDSLLRRYLSNRYNAEPRPMLVQDPAATWATPAASATLRQANANTANLLDYICCVSRPVAAEVFAQYSSSTTGAVAVIVGVGVDSITVSSAQAYPQSSSIDTNGHTVTAAYYGYPGVGRHTLAWLEKGGGSATQTWYGTSAGGYQSAMLGGVNN